MMEAETMRREENRSFLLRLWRVRDDGQNWRAMLQDVETGERHGFASLEALAAYLRALDSPKAAGEEKSDE